MTAARQAENALAEALAHAEAIDRAVSEQTGSVVCWHEFHTIESIATCHQCSVAFLLNAIEAALVALREHGEASEKCPGCDGDAGNNWFDRSLCPEPCGRMHPRCRACGEALDGCYYDTPALRAVVSRDDSPIRQALEAIAYCRVSPNECSAFARDALVALRERGEPVTKEDAETDAHESFLLDVNHPDHGGIEDTDDALWELVGVAEAYFTADTDDERQTAESMFHSMRARLAALAAAVPDGPER